MTEQELKIVLQGAIDGKEIQCKWYPNGSFQKVNWDELSTLIAGLNAYHREYPFRVKPNTLKYRTRPCMTNSILFVWTSTNALSEKEFEYWQQRLGEFKWLAGTTEHEVDYE